MILDETFASNVSNWPTGPYSSDYLDSTMQIRDGALTCSVEAKQDAYSYRYPQIHQLGDFYLEAGVRQVSGPADSFHGLVFRVSDWRHYFYAISDVGDVVVRKRDNSDGWENSLELVSTAIGKPGGLNTLTILARGPHFVLCVNHQIVAELDEPDYPEGQVGIGVSLSREGDRATLEYTSFKVFEPAQPMPAPHHTSMECLQ